MENTSTMESKFTYVVKDPISHETKVIIVSPYNIEHDAKTYMQTVIRESQKIKELTDGEYIVQTHRVKNDEECGPINSFIVKDEQITFNEPPYGKDSNSSHPTTD